MGAFIAVHGARRLALVTVIVIVVGGIGTWLVSPSNVYTVGASGVVFGYATYLFARGLFDRNIAELLVGVIVGFVWGAALCRASSRTRASPGRPTSAARSAGSSPPTCWPRGPGVTRTPAGRARRVARAGRRCPTQTRSRRITTRWTALSLSPRRPELALTAPVA